MMTTAGPQRVLSEYVYLSAASQEVVRLQRYLLAFGLERGISTSLTEGKPGPYSSAAERQFARLADLWRQETRYMSSIHEMVLHPAYQQIVGMGQEALPLIFEELKHQPDHWFWALQAITGENPVPLEDRGKIAAMARHWIRWAEGRGICSVI